jgi:hypothetical protein
MLRWTVDTSDAVAEEDATHYANFGRGRYSVTRSHGSEPWFQARWHRWRRVATHSKIIGSAPTLEAAKEVCKHHAAGIVAAIRERGK